MNYSIWFEFEEYENPEDVADGYCNMEVTYDDGRREGYNVWTIEFFQRSVQTILAEADEQGYATLPDLLVTKLEREHITAVLKQILPQSEP